MSIMQAHESDRQQNVDVIQSYDAMYGDQQVLVLANSDYRVPAAIEIEKFNMLLLGDPEELVDKDLALALTEARFLAVYPKSEEPGQDNMLGVVRITDADPIDGTLRSFREAAEVTGDDYATIWLHFVAQTHQNDPAKVYDVNTYGLAQSVWDGAADGDRQFFNDVKHNLMAAMVKEGIRVQHEHGATHGISYFNEFSWDIFKKKGYDWVRLNGYEAVKDRFVFPDGTMQEGQPLVPTVLHIEQQLDLVRASATRHLGELSVYLAADLSRA